MKKKQLWFLTFDKDCPLGFAERLVYSHLVSKIRHGKSQAAKDIADHTGLHRGASVAPALAELQSHGLAELSKDGWGALPPSGSTGVWFVKRKSKSQQWFDRLAYFPIALPNRAKLKTRCAVVYWFLIARSHLTRPQNITGIAKCLSIGWATAARAVNQLRELGLINDEFRPTEIERNDLWREGRKPNKKKPKPTVVDNYRMSSLFLPKFCLEGFKNREHLDQHVDQVGSKMRRAGYSEEDIFQYVRETYGSFGNHLKNAKMSLFMRFSVESLFTKAERETEKNRANNRFQGKNSLGLLHHLTKAFVDRINKAHEGFDDVQYHVFEVAA